MSERDVTYKIGELMKKAGLKPEFEGTKDKRIAQALSKASKRGSGHQGIPDIVVMSDGIPIIVEVKADPRYQRSVDETDHLRMDFETIAKYADNGAVFYAGEVMRHGRFKQAIAVGCTAKKGVLNIQPYICQLDTDGYTCLYDPQRTVRDFTAFSESDARDYISVGLGLKYRGLSDNPKELAKICRDLRTKFDKVTRSREERNVLMGLMLLAKLDKTYSEFDLKGDPYNTDCKILKDHTEATLRKLGIVFPGTDGSAEDVFYDILDTLTKEGRLNKRGEDGQSPIRRLAIETRRYIHKMDMEQMGQLYSVFTECQEHNLDQKRQKPDLGLYGQAMVSTLNPVTGQVILDPFCGDGAFIKAVSYRVGAKAESRSGSDKMVNKGIYGMESDPWRYTTAIFNVILSGARRINVVPRRFPDDKLPTGNKRPDHIVTDISERDLSPSDVLSLLNSMLNTVRIEGTVFAIVPMKAVSGDAKGCRVLRSSILDHNRLVSTIRLDDRHCIVYLSAGKPHDKTATRIASPSGTDDVFDIIDILRDNRPSNLFRVVDVAPDEWWVNPSEKGARVNGDDITAYMRDWLDFVAEQRRNGMEVVNDGPAEPAKSFKVRTIKTANYKANGFLEEDSAKPPKVSGTVPTVIAKKGNNGWGKFAPADGDVHKGECIAVSLRGRRVVAVTYQPVPFKTSGQVIVLRTRRKMPRSVQQYIVCAMAKKLIGGEDILIDNASDLLNLRLTLPAGDGVPDWRYMGNRMRLAEKECRESTIASYGGKVRRSREHRRQRHDPLMPVVSDQPADELHQVGGLRLEVHRAVEQTVGLDRAAGVFVVSALHEVLASAVAEDAYPVALLHGNGVDERRPVHDLGSSVGYVVLGFEELGVLHGAGDEPGQIAVEDPVDVASRVGVVPHLPDLAEKGQRRGAGIPGGVEEEVVLDAVDPVVHVVPLGGAVAPLPGLDPLTDDADAGHGVWMGGRV